MKNMNSQEENKDYQTFNDSEQSVVSYKSIFNMEHSKYSGKSGWGNNANVKQQMGATAPNEELSMVSGISTGGGVGGTGSNLQN